MGKNDNIRAKIADRSEAYEDSTTNEETQDLNAKIEVISHLPKKAFVWKGDEVRAYIHAPFGYEYLKIAEGCEVGRARWNLIDGAGLLRGRQLRVGCHAAFRREGDIVTDRMR